MQALERAERFHTLHQKGAPLVLFNIWDVGSALTIAKAGADALATGSWSIASAQGFGDGEKIPRQLLMDMLLRITTATELPVSVDLESGYGETLEAVAETLALSVKVGAIGCNLEDSYPADGSLREVKAAALRIRAARRAVEAACPRYFINARTDVFFQASAAGHQDSMVEEVLARARAYAEAGANGLFVPGLNDLALIRKLTSESPLPLNVMRLRESPTIAELAAAGVARTSHGPYPYLLAMQALEQAARAAK